jgi:hypothetical protein
VATHPETVRGVLGERRGEIGGIATGRMQQRGDEENGDPADGSGSAEVIVVGFVESSVDVPVRAEVSVAVGEPMSRIVCIRLLPFSV